MTPKSARRRGVAAMAPAAWPEQALDVRDAEAVAAHFGLVYLSREGFEKLARLIAWVRSGAALPPVEHPTDIVKPPPERVG